MDGFGFPAYQQSVQPMAGQYYAQLGQTIGNAAQNIAQEVRQNQAAEGLNQQVLDSAQASGLITPEDRMKADTMSLSQRNGYTHGVLSGWLQSVQEKQAQSNYLKAHADYMNSLAGQIGGVPVDPNAPFTLTPGTTPTGEPVPGVYMANVRGARGITRGQVVTAAPGGGTAGQGFEWYQGWPFYRGAKNQLIPAPVGTAVIMGANPSAAPPGTPQAGGPAAGPGAAVPGGQPPPTFNVAPPQTQQPGGTPPSPGAAAGGGAGGTPLSATQFNYYIQRAKDMFPNADLATQHAQASRLAQQDGYDTTQITP